MTGPLSVTMFVMTAYAVSLMLLAYRKHAAHGIVMLSAILVDTALTIYLVVGAHALHKFVGAEEVQALTWLLWFHGLVATVMLALYVAVLINGSKLLFYRLRDGTEHPTRWRALARHKKMGPWVVGFYFSAALTCPGGPIEWLARWLGA